MGSFTLFERIAMFLFPEDIEWVDIVSSKEDEAGFDLEHPSSQDVYQGLSEIHNTLSNIIAGEPATADVSCACVCTPKLARTTRNSPNPLCPSPRRSLHLPLLTLPVRLPHHGLVQGPGKDQGDGANVDGQRRVGLAGFDHQLRSPNPHQLRSDR